MNEYLLNDEKIKETYEMIREYHEKYLKKFGVKLPDLCRNGDYTKDALVLVYLAYNYPKTEIVSKSELTDYIKKFYKDITDVQQARHLGAQKGWYILSGTRRDINEENIPYGSYKLVSLEKPYPGFKPDRRTTNYNLDEFEELKKKYNHRCATCGSKEGEPNYNWPNTITTLQAGHMNPNKPLKLGNIIPQCEKCNRADRNRWIYDNRGRVISIANPNVIDTCSNEVKKAIYKILYETYDGKKPDEV